MVPPRRLGVAGDRRWQPSETHSKNERLVGGCLRLEIPRRELIYRLTDQIGNAGVQIFRLALGDHGIFCRRAAFEAIGGYPDVPILEDAELYRKLRRVGEVRQLQPRIISSPRTYERLGRYRTTATYFLILVLYILRVPIPSLHKLYRRLHATASSAVARQRVML